MLIDPKAVRWTAIITLYIAAAVILFEGLGSEKQFLQRTSWVPAAIVVALTIYEHWLWKIGPLGIPVLDGTWKVVLTSNWRDPDDQDTAVVRSGYFVFRQTATLLSVTLYTEESGSLTLASHLQREKNGQYSLSWMYQNVSQLDPKKSPMHYGAVVTHQLSGRRPSNIRGVYFTNRLSDGSFKTSGERNPRRAGTFSDAEQLFEDV